MSEKLRKYLKYYQKILSNDPENIEARLRLAAIFRELGKTSHAVEEYTTASKLLAKEGLPLEAIAACKAVIELDPTQTEIQFFLARLFAQVPQVGGMASRVAKPKEPLKRENPFLLTKPLVVDDDDEITIVRDSNLNKITPKIDNSERSLPPQPDKHTEDTRLYSDREIIKDVESFEIGVFDYEGFDLDIPSEEIDLAFLEELEISLSETSVIEDLPFEVVKVKRSDLPSIPLFSELGHDAFVELLNEIELHSFEKGEVLLGPYSDETSLSILIKGQAKVTREVGSKTVLLDQINEGEFFGEFRLLTGRRGAATITSLSDVEVLRLSEDMIDRIARKEPDIWDVLWEFYHFRMLNNLLATGPVFLSLSEEKRNKLASKFSICEVVAGELLLRFGEPCKYLYLVLLGEVSIENPRDDGLVEELAVLREGEYFGISSSLDQSPYIADVRTTRDTTLLCLPAKDFQEIVNANPKVEEDIERFVSSRRKLNNAFTSGMTDYAELGIHHPFLKDR